jgi:hypothetical protein
MGLWVALVASPIVSAWPVDQTVALGVDAPLIRPLAALEFVESKDPAIATAEVLPAGELLLQGLKPGSTLLLLYAEGKMAVWRLDVGPAPSAGKSPVNAPATEKPCKGVKIEGPAQERSVSGTVGDETCRQALLERFKSPDLLASRVELTFELSALQAQLQALHRRLAARGLEKKVRARYLGAGLLLEGDLTAAEHRQVLWEVFHESVGRTVLDDRLQLPPVHSETAEGLPPDAPHR